MTDQVSQPATEWQNLFGICAALGEDFGFNPLWLRIAFGAGIVFAPVAVIAAYFGLGLLVLATRLMIPNRPAPAPAERPAAANSDEPLPSLKQAA